MDTSLIEFHSQCPILFRPLMTMNIFCLKRIKYRNNETFVILTTLKSLIYYHFI